MSKVADVFRRPSVFIETPELLFLSIKKKRHLISVEKIHAIKNTSYNRKKIPLKKTGSFQLN